MIYQTLLQGTETVGQCDKPAQTPAQRDRLTPAGGPFGWEEEEGVEGVLNEGEEGSGASGMPETQTCVRTT